MEDRCININNINVIRLSKELGLPPAVTASKIAVWQVTNGNKIPTVEDLLKEESVQENVVNRLLSLQGKQEQFEDHYKVEGFETELKRPSSLAKSGIQNKEQAKTPQQIRDQEIYTGLGTLAHNIQAEIIRRNFPEYNTHRQEMEIPEDSLNLFNYIDDQISPIIQQAKKEGTVLVTEMFVGNIRLQRGGTIDLLGITKDGNYKLYDLKTRFTPDKNIKRRYNKLKEFSKQLGEYKKILEEGDSKLGVVKGKVSSTQVIESNLKVSLKTGKIKSYNDVEIVAPLFARTEDTKLNDFINRLQGQIDILINQEPSDPIKHEVWTKLLNSKIDLMQSLQIKQDASEIINYAAVELAAVEVYLQDEENLDTTNLRTEISLYSEINKYVEVDSLTPELKRSMEKVFFQANNLLDKLEKRGKEVVEAAAVRTVGEKFVDELFSPIKDIGFFRKMVMGVSSTNNPLVATAYKTLTEALAKGRSKLDDLKDKLIPIIEQYRQAVGSLDYSIILSDDKRSLVDKYSKEFWVEYYNRKKVNDIKWSKANLDYDEEAYDKAYKNKLAFEDSTMKADIERIKAWLVGLENQPEDLDKTADKIYWYGTETSKGRTQRIKEWLEDNEKNSFRYFKPKDKWIDSKWKEIKEGKWKGTGVEKFYDFYTNYMSAASELSPGFFRPTFIPNFSQTFLERTTDMGLLGAIQGSWSELLNNLELTYDENLYGKIDPYTGEQLRKLFIPGLSKVEQNKSLDLGVSLLTFMEGVYRYDELSQIENTVNEVKYQLRNLNELRFDSLGNPIEGETKVNTKVNNSKQISEQFEYFVDAIMYGKKQKDEGAFELKGNGFTQALGLLNKGDSKKIAYAKIADGLVRYTGLRNLSFNMYAPLVNLLGGSANMYMSGASGIYYSNSDLSKALRLTTAGKINLNSPEALKARLILNWLQIDKEKIDRDIFKKVSNAPLSKFTEQYNGMSLMRESESTMVESAAVAMLLSNKHNLNFDDFEVKDGKLEFKKDISTLDKETFRQKVIRVNGKNIGAMNPDDVLLAKKWMVGRMLMQHRSWLPQLAYERFGKKQYDFILEKDIEGRYRVAARAIKEIMTKGFSQGLEALSADEIAIAKSAFAEVLLIAGTGLISFALKGLDDDDDKEAWLKYTNTVFNRTYNELIFFADPTFSSQFQILLSPAPTTSTVQELGKLVRDSWREVAADLYEDPEKTRKQAKPGKRIISAIPHASQVQRFIDTITEEE